jgi:hypothetical protein
MPTSYDDVSIAIASQQDTVLEGTHQFNKDASNQNSISTLPPEILQSVFRHLPFFDLLRCQQVCRQWRAYLPGNDPALQRETFCKARIATTAEVLDIEVFVSRQSWSRAPGPFTFVLIFRPRSPGMELHPLVQYPIEGVLRKYLRFSGMQMDRGNTIKGVQRACEWQDCRYTKAKSRLTDVTASWESMLLCAPAIQQVKVTTRRPVSVGYKHYDRLLTAEEGAPGVTLGQVMQVIGEELELSRDALSPKPRKAKPQKKGLEIRYDS